MSPCYSTNPCDERLCAVHFAEELRDYFAAAALQVLHGGAADIFVASLVPPEHVAPGEERAYIAKRIAQLASTAYALADAMLAERSRQS